MDALVGQHTATYNSSSQGSNTYFWLRQASELLLHAHTQTLIHTYNCFVLFVVFVFQERISLYNSSDCPKSGSVNQADLKFTDTRLFLACILSSEPFPFLGASTSQPCRESSSLICAVLLKESQGSPHPALHRHMEPWLPGGQVLQGHIVFCLVFVTSVRMGAPLPLKLHLCG